MCSPCTVGYRFINKLEKPLQIAAIFELTGIPAEMSGVEAHATANYTTSRSKEDAYFA